MRDVEPVGLRWMPKQVADELQRELDALCGLRLMLAGLAIRHANGDEGLRADIGVVQVALQVLIDRNAESAAWLRRLAAMIEAQPQAEPDVQSVH